MVRYLDLFHGKFHITIPSDIDVSYEDLRRLDSQGNACHVYKLGYVYVREIYLYLQCSSIFLSACYVCMENEANYNYL